MAAPLEIADDKLATLRQITHVIFDVDGLILDSETLYTKGTQLMLNPYNAIYTKEMKVKVMGRPRTEVAKMMIEELNLPLTVQEFVDKLQDEIEKLMPTAELMPGADRLIRHLSAHAVPMAIATGAAADNHELKTSNHGDLFSLFGHEVLAGSDPEVTRGKPHPECYMLARDRFKPPPDSSKILVFEDAPNGVLSAVGAGMHCIWVPDPTIVSDIPVHPLRKDAFLVLDSLEQFNPEWIGLPPFE